jgi:hypothetical protein
MKRWLFLVLSVLMLSGLTGPTMDPRETAALASPASAQQEITTLQNGMLLVTMPNPPRGGMYEGDYALTVPDGEQWHLLSVSFNLTTAPPSIGGSATRRLKWVLRDPTDLVNPGRLYTVLAEGLGDYVYKDFSLQIGQNLWVGKNGPGTSLATVRSPANAALPDMWIPAGFQWVTVSEGHTDRDQLSFFYAFVEQKPL